MKKSMEAEINKIIESIRPYINEDGGDVEFIKLDDNYVFIKLYGACTYCGFQDNTINYGILKMINEKFPEIEGVINVEL